jgi:cytidine deaminase
VKAADIEPVIAAARQARTRAYAPYSRYRVGAALLTRAGRVFTGCNVENASYGATICAERSAVAAMVAAGDREPLLCVVVTAGPNPGTPCGICRQVLAEFAGDMCFVLVAEDARGQVIARSEATLAGLLPRAFRLRKPEVRRPKAGGARSKAKGRGRGNVSVR